MPIIFDQVTAEIAPPNPGAGTRSPDPTQATDPTRPDPETLLREIQRLAERAERLKAD